MVNDLDYKGIELPISKKHLSKIEKKNNICINVFCYENNLVYPVYVSSKKNWKFHGFIDDNRWK